MSLSTLPHRQSIPRIAAIAPIALLVGLLAGCGGAQDYGGFSRSLGGDIATGYNAPLATQARGAGGDRASRAVAGAFPMIETSFELPHFTGDPFDYETNSIMVELRKPDGGTVEVPGFFDGGTTWRIRYTPLAAGKYQFVAVKLNKETAHEEKLEKREWSVTGEPGPGFVRIDRGDHSRFVFENGARYYPLGHNQAWSTQGLPDTPLLFGKMHDAGENWSRVWATHWDGKNLDWPQSGKPGKLGAIDLEAAKQCDAIVASAEKNGIYFQWVVQHHGQVSSRSGFKYSGNVDPNWDANPYSAALGGFLKSPEEFFSSPRARALTRRKLYYMLARWGYSPSILSFELFNEVEGTDAAHGKLWDDIALWHKEMAIFLRQNDPNRHLITTSSATGIAFESPIWDSVDYVQVHTYPPDVLAALSSAPGPAGKKLDKPIFVGEFGPAGSQDPEGAALHQGLWASIMSSPSGAAEYWYWDNVEKNDLYKHFRGVSTFLTASALPSQTGLVASSPAAETEARGDLRLGFGGGWGAATENEFVVGSAGAPPGLARFPAYLQGRGHLDMMPKPLTLHVSSARTGEVRVTVSEISQAGASLDIAVDGGAPVKRQFAAGGQNHRPGASEATLSAPLPSGAHTITIQNTGADWLVVRDITLTGYAPALGALVRSSRDFAAGWLYNRGPASSPVAGKLPIAGLDAGAYTITWWDTLAGRSLSTAELTVTKQSAPVTLIIPAVSSDVAFYVTRAGKKEAPKAAQPVRKPQQAARGSRPGGLTGGG